MNKLYLVVAFACVLPVSTALAQERGPVQIDIDTKLDKRTPVVVPPFAATPEAARYSVELANVLARDLDFSGHFRIIDRTKYPAGFRELSADPNQIDFEPWRSVEAEYLVQASVYFQNNPNTGERNIYADCRLFEIFTGEQVVGRRIPVSEKSSRRIAHSFADEIVRSLEGTPGCADSQIVFSVRQAPTRVGERAPKEIYMADYDGANLVRLTNFNSISIRPKLSPDARKVAFMSYKDRYPFLYVYDRVTGATTALSKHVGLNSSVAWSPDGRTVALCLSKDGNTEIYLKNPDGTNERRLTRDRESDTTPSFSPDGRKIVFVSDRGGSPQIYVMDAEGRGVPRRLSRQGGNSVGPAWSPDGKYIAYVVQKRDLGFQIYMMNADGSASRQMTALGGSNESPSWSPDSRHIIFSSSRGGGASLYTVTLSTGEVRPIQRLSQMQCEGPSWGPRQN